MGRSYEQLSLADRCEIAQLSAKLGSSIRQIAAALDRAPSTISRELKRNRGEQVGYEPSYAQQQTQARRWSGSRARARCRPARAVLDRLESGWSPEQVAGRLKREHGPPVIIYESIYRFIYAQIDRTNDFTWRRYLPRGKSKRGRRAAAAAARQASSRPGSHRQTPAEAADRTDPRPLGSRPHAVRQIRPGHPRHSRSHQPPILLATRLDRKQPTPSPSISSPVHQPCRRHLRQTVTFDNGTEFARHLSAARARHPDLLLRSPRAWQKGGSKTPSRRRLRRFLPRRPTLKSSQPERFYAQSIRCRLTMTNQPRANDSLIYFSINPESRGSFSSQLLALSSVNPPPWLSPGRLR